MPFFVLDILREIAVGLAVHFRGEGSIPIEGMENVNLPRVLSG